VSHCNRRRRLGTMPTSDESSPGANVGLRTKPRGSFDDFETEDDLIELGLGLVGLGLG